MVENDDDGLRKLAMQRIRELAALTDLFVIRRSNVLNAEFLPPKYVVNLFLPLTKFQRAVYESFLKSKHAADLKRSKEGSD